MEVLNIEADLYNYNNYLSNNQRFYDIRDDYQVLTKYINKHTLSILIKRLDKDKGWNADLNVMIVYYDNNTNSIINIGSSCVSLKEVIVNIDFEIYQSTIPLNFLSNYNLILIGEPTKLSLPEFNSLFNTDIVNLPRDIYAFGLHDNKIFVHSEHCIMYYEIIRQVKHIFSIAQTFTTYNHFYFLISCYDGYLEKIYYNNTNDGKSRIVPKIMVSESICNYSSSDIILEDNEYPVFHKKKYVLSQSNNIGIPYTIDVIDRHYFYCDLYHSFRSFHNGLPFSKKINKIIMGCRRDRSNKYNFTVRRDIEISQREYFYSDAVSKDNIVCPDTWINDVDMIKYKYILDVDGNSCTWDATAWKMNSGSVIFKTASRWRQWFYDDYLEWVHFVPINDDFSNLQEIFNWCENNPDKCEIIIKNAKQLFQKVYRFHNIIDYTINILNTINDVM